MNNDSLITALDEINLNLENIKNEPNKKHNYFNETCICVECMKTEALRNIDKSLRIIAEKLK